MIIESNVIIDIRVICDKLYGFRKDGKGARPKSRDSFAARFDSDTPLAKDVIIELFNITAKTRMDVLEFLLDLISKEMCNVVAVKEEEVEVAVEEEEVVFDADEYRITHVVDEIGTRNISSWEDTKYTAVDFPKLTGEEEKEYNAILDEYLPMLSKEIGAKPFYGYRELTREDIWEHMKVSNYVSSCGYEKTFQSSRSYNVVIGTDALEVERMSKNKTDDISTWEPYIAYEEFCKKVTPYRLKMFGLYREKEEKSLYIKRVLEHDYKTAVQCSRPRQLLTLKSGFKRDKKIYGSDKALENYLKKLQELKDMWDCIEVVTIAGKVVKEAKVRSKHPRKSNNLETLLEDLNF